MVSKMINNNKTLLSTGILAATLLLPTSAFANQPTRGFEISPYFGYMSGSEIEGADGSNVDMSDEAHFGVALSWQDSPNGQGQILINYVGHEFDNTTDGSKEDLNILYAHFSGVAQFRQSAYITTFGIGLGGAYLDSDYNSEIYPSATVAVGTRYEFSPYFSLFTELRGYATLTDEDDNLFCKGDVCAGKFDDAVYIDTSISVGLAFAF